jgi:hypothetical protein
MASSRGKGSTARARARTFDALAARELAAVGAIDTAIAAEKRPDHVTFLHEAKDGHQTAAGQLAALVRLAGGTPSARPSAVGKALKLQVALTQRTKSSWTFLAMRVVEGQLLDSYREERAKIRGDSDVFAKSLDALVARASLRWHVLTAHIARSGANGAQSKDARLLRQPLARWFADPAAPVCMRCLLDRPAQSARALTREDPLIRICAACHEETLASFPVDLMEPLRECAARTNEDHVIERALSKPSKETARVRVYTTLVAETARERAAMPGAQPMRAIRAGEPSTPSVERVHARGARVRSPIAYRDELPSLDLALDAAEPHEREYTTALFDPSTLARSW